MSKHMQEPWPPFIDICEPATPHPDSDGFVALGFDDYRRAKACVNALAGVPTEWVEKFSISGSENVAQENARLTKQRDQLLGSLETLYRDYVRVMEAGRDRIMDLGGFCDPVDVMERADPSLASARAAIAKAKGIDHE